MSRLTLLIVKLPSKPLLAAASVCTMIGLFFMVAPTFSKSPLLVMAGMSFGHAFGLLGVVLFAATVLKEAIDNQAARRDSDHSERLADSGRSTASAGPEDEDKD